ncbi:MAG: metal-dependent hydrolase [Halobacteriales archaeon]
MGSFEDHMRYGVASYVLAVVIGGGGVAYLFSRGMVGVSDVVVAAVGGVAAFPFAVAGAGFPDIDHHAARPHRFFKKWVSVIAAVVGAYLLFVSGVAVEAGTAAVDEVATASVVPEPVVGGGVAAVGGVAAAGTAYLAVTYLKPPHRGVTHSLSTGVVVAAGVGVGIGYAASMVAPLVLSASPPMVGALAGGIAGGGFLVGFLSHLQCDGLLVGVLPDAM